MAALKLFVLLSVLGLVFAEVTDFKTCPNDPGDCTISQVRIDPCPQAVSDAACHIRRRKSSVISFDYTPNFDADSLDATVGWVKSPTEVLPLVTLDKDACKYTPCPVRSGESRTYTIAVPIESKFPLNAYTIRWVLKAPNGKQCCLDTDIRIVR